MTDNNFIFAFLAILLVLYFVATMFKSEGFNSDTTEFVSEGSERYGLRGDLLRRSGIEKLYMRPDRQVRLSHSGDVVYYSDRSTPDEGVSGCNKVSCPNCYGGFDDLDTCWKCGDPRQQKMD